MILNFFIVLFSLASIGLSEKFDFTNYTLYKVLPENEAQVTTLRNIQNSDLRFDFWNELAPLAVNALVLSSPQHKNELENLLNENEIKYEIKNNNIQEAINKEKSYYGARNTPVTNMQWNTYYNLEQINSWLDHVASEHSSVSTIVKAGESFEERDIRGIRISHGSGRRVIFVEAGIHSREFISPASACYLIYELLYSQNADIRAAARDYDWYIFPVTNPDGYVWAHEQNRMWRKNRRPIGANFGVDLNRNWNSNWLVAGSSVNPATDNYAGPGPFSEIETRSMSAFLRTIGSKIDLYLSLHSFGQLLLIPFGNSTNPYANYHDAINIGRRAMGALSVRYGTQYVTGNIAEAIYHATGGSIDWVKGHLKVPLVYCYEFRDKGQNGFLLPVDEILPNNQEFLDSVIDLIYQAKRFDYMNKSSRASESILMLLAAAFVTMFRY